MQRVSAVVVWSVLVLWGVVESMGLHCPAHPSSTTLKFSVTSKRNKTGHWIAQVSLNHESASNENREWLVEVDHTSTKCENSDVVQLMATATAPPSRPRADYEFFPGLGYYRFHEKTVTWPVARETCAQEGANLLILNSEEEFAAVKKMWEKYPNIASDWRNTFIHLGLTDHVQEGQFYTLFGDHINSTGYTTWNTNEPNSGNTANCLGVTKEGLLMDSSCNNELAFVCELFS